MGSRSGPEPGLSPAVRWSIYAGVYLFICGLLLALALSDILGLLADVIGLPAGYWMFVIPGPVLIIGPGLWWGLIEGRRSFGYRYGALFGILTAVLTGLLWTGIFVGVWGLEMLAVPMVSILAALVLGFVALAGLLTGIGFMYGRRRFGPGPP